MVIKKYMSLRDKMNEGAKEYGAENASNFFKFDKSGDYKIRILTEPVAIATHFFGKGVPARVCYGMEKGCPFHGDKAGIDDNGNEKKPSVKFIAYVIDRKDGKIKLGELPWSVVGACADFQEDEDFKFSSYPMPYDVKVKYDKENKDKKSIYKTIASPNIASITTEESNILTERINKTTPESFVNGRKTKELEKQKSDGTWDKEFSERKARINESQENSEKVDEMEYPEEDIDPKDIPF